MTVTFIRVYEKLPVDSKRIFYARKKKPLLAPLAFAGLAVVGLFGTARKWEAEVV